MAKSKHCKTLKNKIAFNNSTQIFFRFKLFFKLKMKKITILMKYNKNLPKYYDLGKKIRYIPHWKTPKFKKTKAIEDIKNPKSLKKFQNHGKS